MTKTNNPIKKSRHVLIYLKDSMNTMDTNNQQFNQRDVSIEEKISRLIDKKLTELQNSVDEMDTRVLDQLDTIEEKLDSMEEKLNNLEELLN